MNQAVTLDQAILNMDSILAHILCEQDPKLKGLQLAHGWQQLKALKEAVAKLGYFDRRKYNKMVVPLEQKLLLYEDNYISSLELSFAIEDGKKLNELIQNYKGKNNAPQRLEIREKIIYHKTELEEVVKKNLHRTSDQQWQQVLIDSQNLLQSINNYINAQTDDQIKLSAYKMNVSFKSIRQERRIQNEEEEELLQIVDKLALLKEMQANINLHVEEEGLDLNQIEQKVAQTDNNTQQTLQQYQEANQFVKRRRRTKLKLFFTGIFTAIGSLGGKVGAFFGASFGLCVGNQVGNRLQRQDTV